nr:PREDICTED: uncharacterized protein LOC108224120 isoform X2 [Daucus carota subsp. sativus]XP_017254167.1 PREDICTED: uncharacterized protein LOC108224120 isoform X2 [Daucus carota subsp. sativus]
MGGQVEIIEQRKPKFLCLHGFRTSGHILKTQLHKWPEFVLEKLDLVFPDAPLPCTGKSGVEGIFDPPYYEWYRPSKDCTEYTNFDGCLEYIQECMIKHGPFDGLLGFSQGAFISAALPGLQAKGLALTEVPKIKFVIIISGGKLHNEAFSEKAFSEAITCPSLHFLGETDFLKPHGTALLESFVDPVVIHHPKGHTIPRLDEKGLELMLGFLEKIQKELTNQEVFSLDYKGFTTFKSEMADEAEIVEQRKPKFLCLHGFRTSGHILKTQLHKWPQFVLDKLDLVIPDAPFPCTGKSSVEGIFDPPYYEWFQPNKDFTVFTNFDECLEYIQECMIKHGPFDGLLGFSQGAFLSAALPGMQAKGLALTKVPKIKFVIIISGGKLKNEALLQKAFSDVYHFPSLHILGEMDFLKPQGTALLESFADPVVIHHPKGHTIPRLDEKSLELMLGFLEKIQKELTNQEAQEEKCSDNTL